MYMYFEELSLVIAVVGVSSTLLNLCITHFMYTLSLKDSPELVVVKPSSQYYVKCGRS